MSKVEDVARAIESAIKSGEDPARAAIAAMREPTQGMLEASDPIYHEAYDGHAPRRMHYAMIDAALNEGGKPLPSPD